MSVRVKGTNLSGTPVLLAAVRHVWRAGSLVIDGVDYDKCSATAKATADFPVAGRPDMTTSTRSYYRNIERNRAHSHAADRLPSHQLGELKIADVDHDADVAELMP